MSANSKSSLDFDRALKIAMCSQMERFAEALVPHIEAYGDLERIAGWRVNPEYREQNLLQQAGYSAEVKSVARRNAEAMIAKSGRRVARTDDVGHVNHETFDHVDVGRDRRPLLSGDGAFVNGAQLKVFKRVNKYRGLAEKNFEKYRDAALLVPTDQLKEIRADWQAFRQELESQRARLLEAGKQDLVRKLDEKIKRLEDAESRLADSGVSTTESMEARRFPLISTIKDGLRVGHRAGVEGAKVGGLMAGGFSVIRNSFRVAKGEKKAADALKTVVGDTGRAIVTSYATGATTSIAGGALKASSRQFCQNLARGSGPAAIIQVTTIIASSTFNVATGKLSKEAFVREVGRQGAELASSLAGANVGALVGTAMLPGVGTLVGGVLGGLVASMLCGTLSSEIRRSLELVELSRERAASMERLCQQLVEEERRQRSEALMHFNQAFASTCEQLRAGFEEVARGLKQGVSIDSGLTSVARALGFELAFPTDEQMLSHLRGDRVLVI